MTRSALVACWFVSLALIAPAQEAVPPAEHLSPYGLAEPVLIVAGELPKEFDNADKVPILTTFKDMPPVGFQFLKTPVTKPLAGMVGIHVPPGAVFQIRKRSMSNLGKGAVTLRLAESAQREARTVTLEGKKTADYNELRRSAAERAVGSPYPPKETGKPVVPSGTLVIVGGGGMPADIAKRFIEAGGGPDGHFVVLPVSMPDPIKTQAEETFIRRLGAKNVTVIPYREKKDLEDPKVIDVLKKATGLWFGGGRQWNFMDAYEGTKLPDLFRDVLKRGGVIGGSSAGATIQGDYMVRGAPAGPNIMMCEGYERALGFLPGVGIDQHFSARNRFKDMTAFMKAYPQFLGIGLDEATAIVVRGSQAEILGKGKVHFYDRRKPVKDGEPDYEAFPAGTKYDLVKRKVIEADVPAAAK
ncbi:cyanophycinase [Fimbriiglobus ruber]|uniref:Cyanophycinase n=1 Tax=Fimbriiglobus ruber TaxID=1908690 RepID=A0A225DZE1_9BACT|nr:cyanophycinase [Fimbriiglobus ruber]OWK46880.1 Cyanophycinase [Fimbriiglobus ruber]